MLPDFQPLLADMHSHLLPGIDDGAATLADSVAMIATMAEMGYQKLITTPHIMVDFYRNTPEIILEKLDMVKLAVREAGIEIELEAAAEYYLDEGMMALLSKESPMLCFGGQKRYLLFELPYMNESHLLSQAIFLMQSQGYKPVLAHPERYLFYTGQKHKLREMHERGVLFQVNINSLAGYYSPAARDLAIFLVQERLVDFLGTDCHAGKHLAFFKAHQQDEWMRRASHLELLNPTLL